MVAHRRRPIDEDDRVSRLVVEGEGRCQGRSQSVMDKMCIRVAKPENASKMKACTSVANTRRTR